jgi:DNA topoisomerase I
MVSKKSKSLLVVESPAKAKTIKKYLGSDFDVKASVGHVMDLPSKELGVDLEKDFTPKYVTMRGKVKVLSELGKASEKVGDIYLATDPDREGEAIAKHIADYIDKKFKKDKKNIHRILVNEITSKGIKKALQMPGKINLDKFNSQQARRILDRLVGYKISPILWKKVTKGLSAGRVQSVAVRLIVERETEIDNFKPVEYWILGAIFDINANPLESKLFRVNGKKADVKNKDEANGIYEKVLKGNVKVESIEKKERKRNPKPPFITSKLQQDGARTLKFTPKRTMAIAQSLYEGVELGSFGSVGLITYMRTDSVRVNDDFKKDARSFIKTTYGDEYLPEKANFYKTKKSAQDAHEAIRPTSLEYSPLKIKEFLSSDQFKLYSLIWNRAIASQMNPSIYDQTTIDFNVESSGDNFIFRTTGSVLKFDGYEKAYREYREEEEKNLLLPEIKKEDKVKLVELKKEQKFTKPPSRYNVASIIKELEEKGIGRPSTYASIISTIQDRGYVEKMEGGQFTPTELGKIVNELLIKAFPDILNVDFTAGMEDRLDNIEEGKENWVNVLKDFYKDFEKDLKSAEDNMRNVKKEEVKTGIKCPSCGSEMLIKWSRNGQFLACSNFPTCRTTRNFTKDEKGNIKIEEEKTVDEKCPSCGKKMTLKSGRFGRFLACIDYPKCKTTKSISIGVKCPECGGDLTEKITKRGKVFYSCSNYPKCKFAVWNTPVAKTCKECGFKVMEELKDKYKCANKECGAEEEK